MDWERTLLGRVEALDHSWSDEETAGRLSGSQFCFPVLHHLNAKRIPPGRRTVAGLSPRGARSPRVPVMFDRSSFPCLALQGALCPSPKSPNFMTTDRLGTTGNPWHRMKGQAAPGPEMELSKPRSQTAGLSVRPFRRPKGF